MDELDGILEKLLGDPDSLSRAMGIVNALNSGDSEKEKLFDALMPYLKPERRQELMSAVKLARMAKLARLAMTENGDA
ncbi:MAG: hypothetical protein IJP67_00470 [Oscillospiraceae bacterium]|jgi:hypothetical protein|nr:hypothetical protein [Oscillospiraceae bacterium]MBR0062620.1 hypothetical protein [Oscillospiraceae bacterium]